MNISLLKIVLLVLTCSITTAAETTHTFTKGKWNAENWTHVLLIAQREALSFNQKKDSLGNGRVEIKLNDSESLSFRFKDHKMNSTVGLWGCHGSCDFYEMKVK